MKIVVLGAGVQGTLFGVRLAQAGHDVILIARGQRGAELREKGAMIKEALRGSVVNLALTVIECVPAEIVCDLCLVAVRREQISTALRELVPAKGITRFIFLVNHANGSEELFSALGRSRVVLAFPGIAGSVESGVVHYLEVREQPTVMDANAPECLALFRAAGFSVRAVGAMDDWLKRHAVFVTAIAGALYSHGGMASSLAKSPQSIRTFILGVREGWSALDRLKVRPAPLALRLIICVVPLRWAESYWARLLGSARGDLYFGRHSRHTPEEVAALVQDVRAFLDRELTPNLDTLYLAVEHWLARKPRHD